MKRETKLSCMIIAASLAAVASIIMSGLHVPIVFCMVAALLTAVFAFIAGVICGEGV